ncbi:MAG: FAD-binding and (Fe-S)-binding domain-containing protein [Chloroflexota bacterium]
MAIAIATARQQLAADLASAVRGEVRFDDGDRALYATDASNYRQVPIGVVLPLDIEDVIQTVEICRAHGAPVLSRGGGTSLAGQCCNAAVVLDFSRHLNRVLDIDVGKRQATVQPGTILDDLRTAAGEFGLTFGPDPATHNRCTLGGMIGNNSCGVHSVTAGMTSDNIEELDILTHDGTRMRVGRTDDETLQRISTQGGRPAEIYSRLQKLRDTYQSHIRGGFPEIPRRVSGYNLPDLLPERGFNVARALAGSEGTCVTVLEATVRLVQNPPCRSLVVLGYSDIATACDHVPEILEHQPIGLEGFDDRLVRDIREKGLFPRDVALLPPGGGWLLVEFGADTKEEADGQARGLMKALKSTGPEVRLLEKPAEELGIWQVREAALGVTAYAPGKPSTWPGWEDSSVAPDRFGEYLRDLRKLLDRHGYIGAFYGHFGQGCLHTRIDFDLVTTGGIRAFDDFINEAADLVVSYGGSLSGEHGDGQARAALLPKMFGPELMQAFREFKSIWDPENKMNPGKAIDAYPIDTNLRLGADYRPLTPKTHFSFAQDGGSFNHAMLRCVGVGKCRRHDGGTMCPSYMATHEEEHSTRGRARLLFEMLRGDAISGGWRNRKVREALDLCLACKGCKGECPVNVDMATYKAEFLSHYYAHRLRPITAYSMGLIYWWARLASRAPRLVNLVAHAPLLSGLAKRAGGVAPGRSIPYFATQTFTQWFASRAPMNQGSPEVLLWPDTFNNYFHPDTARAAVEVLEAAGFRVRVPQRSLCCGRPLYDFGFLTQAKNLLTQILDSLRSDIRSGAPIVVLEPSCAAVFRDELINLLPDDEDAHRLHDQTFLLSEFLHQRAPHFTPKLRAGVLVHVHCHHKSILGTEQEEAVLRSTGVDYVLLDDGCCGMAGAFGFEREHYDISLAVGERSLLPAVRAAAPETLIVTDGFSCREQIAQTTDRRAIHLAQLLRMALRAESPNRPS